MGTCVFKLNINVTLLISLFYFKYIQDYVQVYIEFRYLNLNLKLNTFIFFFILLNNLYKVLHKNNILQQKYQDIFLKLN